MLKTVLSCWGKFFRKADNVIIGKFFIPYLKVTVKSSSSLRCSEVDELPPFVFSCWPFFTKNYFQNQAQYYNFAIPAVLFWQDCDPVPKENYFQNYKTLKSNRKAFLNLQKQASFSDSSSLGVELCDLLSSDTANILSTYHPA